MENSWSLTLWCVNIFFCQHEVAPTPAESEPYDQNPKDDQGKRNFYDVLTYEVLQFVKTTLTLVWKKISLILLIFSKVTLNTTAKITWNLVSKPFPSVRRKVYFYRF